jgi:L-cysteine S-thiosulfotransferase
VAGCAGLDAGMQVVGDGMPQALTAEAADPARGHRIVVGRDANCLLCHSIPDDEQPAMGDMGPPLAGVGARLTRAQLRLRVVDPTRLNREAAMPAYHRVHGLNEVASRYVGQPVLSARDIEDVVAYLETLR